MSDFHPSSKRWLAGLTLLIAIISIGILYRLYSISIRLGPELVASSRDHVIQERDIQASRGNIYSSDGQLLATSMPMYVLHWDAAVVNTSQIDKHGQKTAALLSLYLPEKSEDEWLAFLKQHHASKDRYALISKGLSYSNYRKVAQTPLFKGDKYKTGLIVEEEFKRLMPYGDLASRTIGYHREDAEAGLESFFHESLSGRSGKRLMQNLGSDQWKPIERSFTVEPQNGNDIVCTIDARMQDAAYQALLKGLKSYDADHGCVVLMEVKTGKIRAIANLGRSHSNGEYQELRNYAVWEKGEPGSTYKVASLLIGLEDGVIDTAEIVDTYPGKLFLPGIKSPVTDSKTGGYGKISIGKALEKSSNTGIVKPLYREYANRPEVFVARMRELGLDKLTGIQVPGESAPFIPNVGDKMRWSKPTLPWMFFGYGVESTPLQTLTFYNAIANDGESVAPTLWEETRSQGKPLAQYEKKVLNPSIASLSSLRQIQNLLEKVVIRGTAKDIYNDTLRMAGKTGTTQLNYGGDRKNMGYQASFAGYFPANDPKYSCIVVINRPDKKKSYFASDVAAPVFRDLAMAVYKMTPRTSNPAKGYWGDGIQATSERNFVKFEDARSQAQKILENGEFPDIIGWTPGEAISLLESFGLSVRAVGNGRVIAAKQIDKTVWIELG